MCYNDFGTGLQGCRRHLKASHLGQSAVINFVKCEEVEELIATQMKKILPSGELVSIIPGRSSDPKNADEAP